MERQVCLVSELLRASSKVENGANRRKRLQLRVQLTQVLEATRQSVHIFFSSFCQFHYFSKISFPLSDSLTCCGTHGGCSGIKEQSPTRELRQRGLLYKCSSPLFLWPAWEAGQWTSQPSSCTTARRSGPLS